MNKNKKIILSQMTRSQKKAYLKIQSGKNVFLTGVAGVGKTWLLNLLEVLTGKKVFLTASTGSASLHLNNGKTVSSFLGLGKYDFETAHMDCSEWLDECILVIDEISMIGKSQWEYIIKSIKKNSSDFRKVQIIVSGDPAQMPPIYWDEPLNEELSDFINIELAEIVRQTDQEFVRHLMDIRFNGLKSHHRYFRKNSGNFDHQGVTLVKDRSIMDKMNNTVERGEILLSYNLNHVPFEERLYESIDIWDCMKVIITRNNRREGYVNGDTGIVVSCGTGDYKQYDEDGEGYVLIEYRYIRVKLDRDGRIVVVREVNETYRQPHEAEISGKTQRRDEYFFIINDKEYQVSQEDYFKYCESDKYIYHHKIPYTYMPILLGYYLSVRRAQGSTLEYGVIHRSILMADVPTQYTALSRFTSVEKINYPIKSSRTK